MHIKPAGSFYGEFTVPGDKSITHRAVMLSSLSRGKSVVKKALLGADCLSTIDCMKKLGADIKIEGDTVFVTGAQKFADGAQLYCGNSGTTMRLLIGLLSGKGINARLTGDNSLSKRPMERVAAPLRLLGANVTTNGGNAPVTVMPAALKGGEIVLETASAQVKSAVVLAALNAEGQTLIRLKSPSRDHTELMLAGMGADITTQGGLITVRESRELNPVQMTVPADISSAAYIMAAGALLGQTTVKNVGINPTRDGILRVFKRMGINYRLDNIKYEGREKTADITVYKSELCAADIVKDDMPYLIDELPIIAVLLARAKGKSKVSGALELRIKESDRIKTTAEMIERLGGNITQTQDGFIIEGGARFKGGIDIDSYDDHRIAMSAAIGLMSAERGAKILRHECADISFPGFYAITGR